MSAPPPAAFVHPSAWVDPPSRLGLGCKIWHFCHLMPGCEIGADSSLGQGVFVAAGVRVGARVKVQNNVSIYAGVTVEDEVFLGPGCVITNVRRPRATIDQRDAYVRTVLRRGCTIGAHATVVCGNSVGAHAFVAAGAVLTCAAPDFALMQGVPARQVGWVGRCGVRLVARNAASDALDCPHCDEAFELRAGALRPRAAGAA